MIRVAAFLVVAAFASPAASDWQYTKWGMSPQSVLAASKGSAVAVTQAEAGGLRIAGLGLEAKYKFPYKSGNYDFDGIFYFKNDKLSAVSLTLRDMTQSASLLQSLTGLYGAAIEQNNKFGPHRVWRDVKSSNLVDYHQLSDISTRIMYTPAGGSDASGL
ncbi:hypothetical protein [Azospirillum brasilense]|uniref:hypothetical protein n=1 Tax=Azospirillum brasilense TaxID=192 RepID=UPI0011A59165|nr:hypothetical protein [Azospirillum brasilense]